MKKRETIYIEYTKENKNWKPYSGWFFSDTFSKSFCCHGSTIKEVKANCKQTIKDFRIKNVLFNYRFLKNRK